VFYADGNGFSKLARKCQTADDLQKWDSRIQAARRHFLNALLEFIDAHPHGLAPMKKRREETFTPLRLRIETLMWGGDEFLLVLPAWLALQAVRLFFETCKVVQLDEKTTCTHSAGLVMAHHKAPISTLQTLAKNLAEQGKQGRYKGQDSLNWTVLESFDHAGSDLERYWEAKGLKQLKWDHMALNPQRLGVLLDTLPRMANELPRSSLYRIAQVLMAWDGGTPPGDDVKRLLARAYDNVHGAVANHRTEWAALWTALQPKADVLFPETPPADFPKPDHLNAWLTLLELWDYAAHRVSVQNATTTTTATATVIA
jgi:hypothetical protein